MLYLDYFFLFLGLNAETTPDESALIDPQQYLFLMKDMFVKKDSEFKIHQSVLFLDKNVENYKGEKLILSLGYDNRIDDASGKVLETALVFKIWNFMSLGGKFLFFIFIFLRL